MTDFDTALVAAYETARFGDGLFGGMADKEDDDDRREKLRIMQMLVRRDHTSLRPLVEARGGTGSDTGSLLATSMGNSAAEQDWDEFLKGLHDFHPHILETFVQARRLAPNPDDREFAMLVADTQAIVSYVELELAGHSEAARLVLQWQLERTY
jgi:hypothetical protein